MNLQFRLNLAIALSMLFIVGIGIVFTIHSARRSVHDEVRSSVNLALSLLGTGLGEQSAAGNHLDDWLAKLKVSEPTRHLQVQIATASTTRPLNADPDAHSTADRVPRWFVWAVHPEAIEVTRTISGPEGPLQVSIKGNPADEIVEAWNEARGFMLLVILQALVVWLLVHLAVGGAVGSIPIILRGLEGLESGRYRERLPDFPVPEFATISRAFNHAASALEKVQKENRDLARLSLALQEEERRTLARELHDELGQSLTAIRVTAASLVKQYPQCKASVDTIETICAKLFQAIRSMIRRLRPALLDELGLVAALEDMAETWREQNPEVAIALNLDESIENIDDDGKIHLFRIVQESLNNIARHASATRVSIELSTIAPSMDLSPASSAAIRLMVQDNGKGFEAERPRGFGLLGMRERTESLGGSLQVDTDVGQGVRIIVNIPFVKRA